LNLLVVGNIGVFNAGDDAILVAFLKWLNEQPDYTYDVYISNKSDYLISELKALHRVKVRLVFGFRLLRTFLSSRVVLICGGDYLDDFGSLTTRLREFVLLFSLALVSKVWLKKFLMVNNGIRANSHLGLSFERLVLRLASCVSVRDEASYKSIHKYKRVIKGFDTAVLWNSSVSNIIESKISSNKIKKIGMSITPFFSNFFSDSEKDSQFGKEVAKSLADLLSHNNDVEICLFAFCTSKEAGDQRLINNIVEFLGSRFNDRVRLIAYNGDILNFLKKLSYMDIMICCKYHSILFSYVLKKPMLVIKYHPKSLALAIEIGLSSKALISVDDVLDGRLIIKISQLLANPSDFEATLPLDVAERSAIHGFKECLSFVEK
jgi:polysaccharide pyruvyl transferase WcaK-like protein